MAAETIPVKVLLARTADAQPATIFVEAVQEPEPKATEPVMSEDPAGVVASPVSYEASVIVQKSSIVEDSSSEKPSTFKAENTEAAVDESKSIQAEPILPTTVVDKVDIEDGADASVADTESLASLNEEVAESANRDEGSQHEDRSDDAKLLKLANRLRPCKSTKDKILMSEIKLLDKDGDGKADVIRYRGKSEKEALETKVAEVVSQACVVEVVNKPDEKSKVKSFALMISK